MTEVKKYRHSSDISGLVPDHHNKVTITRKRVIIFFAGGGSCLQFVKNATFAKYNKMRNWLTLGGLVKAPDVKASEYRKEGTGNTHGHIRTGGGGRPDLAHGLGCQPLD